MHYVRQTRCYLLIFTARFLLPNASYKNIWNSHIYSFLLHQKQQAQHNISNIKCNKLGLLQISQLNSETRRALSRVQTFAEATTVLQEFDDNVAVVATTVASITTGIVQFQFRGGCCFKLGLGLCAEGVSAAQATAVGVAPAPVSLFQLPSHRKSPQTTACERCERH